MGTLTVKLPQPLQAKLDAMVKSRGRRKSDLVREAIERLVDEPERRPQVSVYDLVKDLKGSFRGPKDLSTSPKHMKGFGE